MRDRSSRQFFVSVLISAVCVVIADCGGGDSLAGTYHTEGGGFTLDFKGGSKVTVTPSDNPRLLITRSTAIRSRSSSSTRVRISN